MKYYEFEFCLKSDGQNDCSVETASDVLSALLAEIGFEAFENTEYGLKAYIQVQLYSEDETNAVILNFPFEGFHIDIIQREAEYANWNEQWEKDGFQPIVIGEALCVHDLNHHTLPETGEPLPGTKYELVVSPQMSFGSGTHPTTRQLLETLLEMDVKDMHVVDAGCGTGILGMLCKMKGAKTVSAYDIDEWSVENTKKNALLNNLSLDVWLGDASVLTSIKAQNGYANLLIANINRNILLNDLPSFSEMLIPETGQLLLSGFYEEDVPYLLEKAQTLGLHEEFRKVKDGWVVLKFKKR